MSRLRTITIWALLAIALAVPIAAAAASPLLEYRQPIYIAAGFAGIIAMALMVFQPLLAGGYLPGLSLPRGRRLHRWIGATLVLAVVIHVVALWITSPPDVIDVLLFRSPTWFSVWGAIAMWALFATAVLAALRRRWQLRPRTWRLAHTSLAAVIVAGTVAHAVLIEGTMETVSKTALCVLLLVATAKIFIDLRVWAIRTHRRA